MTDTHCHLNDRKSFPNPAETIAEARDASVNTMIVIGIEPETCQIAVEMAEQFPEVWAVVGCHPNHAHQFDPAFDYESLARHPRVVAVGETGLDYHWDYATRDEQIVAFRAMLDLADKVGKPVVIHGREAYEDILDYLAAEPSRLYHFHCFAGDTAQARRALDLGGYIGVDGPVTYKKQTGLRELVAWLPRDRVLLETDSPYMSPEPFRGKPNSPARLPLIAKAVGEAWGISAYEVGEITSENARRLFGLSAA